MPVLRRLKIWMSPRGEYSGSTGKTLDRKKFICGEAADKSTNSLFVHDDDSRPQHSLQSFSRFVQCNAKLCYSWHTMMQSLEKFLLWFVIGLNHQQIGTSRDHCISKTVICWSVKHLQWYLPKQCASDLNNNQCFPPKVGGVHISNSACRSSKRSKCAPKRDLMNGFLAAQFLKELSKNGNLENLLEP